MTASRRRVSRAVLIGIPKYKDRNNADLSSMPGAADDVADMRRLLRKAGFSRITVKPGDGKKNWTEAAISTELRKLGRGLRRGDRAVMYFSGHGGIVRCKNAQGRRVRREAIFPYDYRQASLGAPAQAFITDEELHELLDDVPSGVLLEVILDSCYSRGMSDIQRSRPGWECFCADFGKPGSRCVLWTSSLDESWYDGRSLFTLAFYRWVRENKSISRRALSKALVEDVTSGVELDVCGDRRLREAPVFQIRAGRSRPASR